ncbi:hypothetical protein COTS27_00181 [Spirochaetota bacterium]|nr:hypothetical protein COTS27_00181 [Spirochaetota bacterium]
MIKLYLIAIHTWKYHSSYLEKQGVLNDKVIFDSNSYLKTPQFIPGKTRSFK